MKGKDHDSIIAAQLHFVEFAHVFCQLVQMKKTLYFLSLVGLLASCSPIYLPNSRNVPMLSKAGEVQGSVSFGSGYNGQAAVAVTNNVAIMANGMFASNREGVSGNVNSYSLWEGGIGYYHNASNNFYFDFFGGFGKGRTYAKDSVFAIHPLTLNGYDKHISSGDFNRFFIQPSFGWKLKHFHGAIAYRISMVNFTSAENLGKPVSIGGTAAFFEPAFVAKFPFDKLVLNVQMGITTPINKGDLYFDYIPFTVSTGIGIRIGY